MLAAATIRTREENALPLSICIILVRMALAERPPQPRCDEADKHRATSKTAKEAR